MKISTARPTCLLAGAHGCGRSRAAPRPGSTAAAARDGSGRSQGRSYPRGVVRARALALGGAAERGRSGARRARVRMVAQLSASE